MKYSGKLTLQPFEALVSDWFDCQSAARTMLAVRVETGSRSGGVDVSIDRWLDESAKVAQSFHKVSAAVGFAWSVIDATNSRQVRSRWESRSSVPSEVRCNFMDQPTPKV